MIRVVIKPVYGRQDTWGIRFMIGDQTIAHMGITFNAIENAEKYLRSIGYTGVIEEMPK